MEAILIISVLALGFLVWKIIEVSDGVSQINARLNNIDTVIAAYYKMLKELQPKAPVEIPARLDKETLKEVVPQLYTSRPAWMDEDINTYKVIERKYDPAKNTILHAVGELDEDEVMPPNEDLSKAGIEYRKNRLKGDIKLVQEYAALEGAELDYLTDEQRVELLKEINKRKKTSLNK